MEEVPIPKATPGIAIVKVVACASNPIDFKVCIVSYMSCVKLCTSCDHNFTNLSK